MNLSFFLAWIDDRFLVENFSKTEEKFLSPYALPSEFTQPLQPRPPNEAFHAQCLHLVGPLRTVARYVRWLCIGQLGVHQVFKERGF
ncbi:hypothetical protein K5D33_07490 [Pseudomonas cichorii]|nr:hypothetical protein [Pseudomonas cichorii]MBX8534567.1 hypothetical protein [Pseudomonas cichorii]